MQKLVYILLFGKHRCVVGKKSTQTSIISLSGQKKGNMICRPVKGEFQLFEVRLRGVGLYMYLNLVYLTHILWGERGGVF